MALTTRYHTISNRTICILVGHYLLAANGRSVRGCVFEDNGEAVREYINDQSNYPINLKFGRVKPTINEKIMLASMFHS